MSTDRESLTNGSDDQTLAVTSRQGECTERTGIWYSCTSSDNASTLWLTGSVCTITSTPSYPSSAASAKAAAVGSGYTAAVDIPTGISGMRTAWATPVTGSSHSIPTASPTQTTAQIFAKHQR